MRRHLILVALCACMSLPCFAQVHGELEKATIKVASEVGRSVVSISSVAKEKIENRMHYQSPFGDSEGDPFRRFFDEFFGELPDRELKRMGLGSGVIIAPDGYILTNEHVIDGATEIKVKLSDGREFDAQVKGMDTRSDLAVIKINAKDLPAAKLGSSDDLQIGEWIVAIGNPFGFAIENPEPTVTVGVVSALHRFVPALGRRDRNYDDLIQTDAAINPGNSGGPLVNLEGEVIGINTAIITTSGGYQGLGFAIPVSKAKVIVAKLIKGEAVSYGWLGASIQNLNEDLKGYFNVKEDKGVIVVKIFKDSPAASAGLKEGDLVLDFGGKPVKATRDLVRMVSFSPVGSIVAMKILRDGKEMTLNVKIGRSPKDLATRDESDNAAETDTQTQAVVSFRGMQVEDISAQKRRRHTVQPDSGVVVARIEDDSPAERSGLVVGDVITRLGNMEVKDKESFQKAASKTKGTWLIKAVRGFFVVKEK